MKFKIVARPGLLQGKAPEFTEIGGEVIEDALLTEEDIIRVAADADAIIVAATEPYNRKVIEQLERCKILSRSGIGYNNIDVAAATDQGIPVAYVPDASISEVADHAMGLVLCFSRRYIPVSQAVRAGAWKPGGKEIPAIRKGMTRLGDQTLGLVGLGRIGSATCRRAKAFGMRIIIYDPFIGANTIKELGAEKVDFERLLAESDFISVHAPLTKDNRQLFGLEQFKKMKRTAYLINTARGGIIDEAALATALTEGYLAGAGLDVTDPEPPKPDNPLLKMENVLITAHSAFFSDQSLWDLRQGAVEAVVAALTGQWPRNLANPQVREKPNCRLNP
ncbi:MAG: C-terminal binding protein [Chloroflexota bacterium]